MDSQDQIRRKTPPPSSKKASDPQYVLLDNVTAKSNGSSKDSAGGDGQVRFLSDDKKLPSEKRSKPQRYPTMPVYYHGSQTTKHQFWWRPIAFMLVLIVAGTAVGLGHHFGYQYLHKKPQEIFSQTWSHNLGIGAAFFVKSSYTLAILTALQEVLWFSFRKRAMKISLLDKLFTLSSNPLSFGPGAVINAPLATALAAAAWIIPISAILAPGSLTIGTLELRNSSTCIAPDFAASYPNISFYVGVPHSLSIAGPNDGIGKLAGEVLAKGTIHGSQSPCGSNCSYQHSFLGPGLECQMVPNPTYIVDEGEEYWLFYNATRDYESVNSSMSLVMTYRNTTKQQAQNENKWYQPYNTIRCLAYNATYDVTVNYTNGQSTFTSKLTKNGPFLNLNSMESGIYSVSNYGVSNASDIDKANLLWRVNSAMLVREIFDNYLKGSWQKTVNTLYALPNTNVMKTTLAGNIDDANYGAKASLWYTNRDFMTGVPELLTNLTLSTLAVSPFNSTTKCYASEETLVYHYNPKLLLIPYAAALLLSLVAFVIGVWVLRRTGMRTGGIFSQILVTTRNPMLDEIARGTSLSSADAEALKEHKLMFGELKHDVEVDRRTGHAAFGSAEQLLKLTGGKVS